ncbi:uncharacterized protein LOC143561545 [Bidens hawaiensis]|uniref:uncharacterized protein LOC143561545 n=1 Tax=Bidens hawaiensis TaxID=980011 RepID=UPI0040494449
MPTQGAMESGDWRAQLQRQRIVNEIMDTLKRHLAFTEYERLQELKKIAERVEEEIYIAATSESEYARKKCFMMLSIDTRLHNSMPPNSGALYNSSANGGDWQVEVYQKIKTMKDMYLYGEDWQEGVYLKIKAMKDLYLQDLNDMCQEILSKLHGHEHNYLQQQKYEQLKKLKVFNNMLERFMQFLQIPKQEILVNIKDRLPTYEMQIINVLNSNKRKPAPPQQQATALPALHMQSLQQSQLMSQLTHRDMQQRLATAGDFQNQNVIDMQKPLCPQKRGMPDSTSLDSTAHTSNQNSGDWQEAVYQKIKAMKEQYLPDLDYMHQKILSKLQNHDSLAQQPKNEQIEKMKVYKNMLERFMQFLQIPKHGILDNYKDKLGTYEKQIINVINSNRRNPAAAQQ